MQLGFGLGFSLGANVKSTTLLLTSSIPSGFTYTGGSNTSTYRNSSGELVSGALNTARFDHTSAGVALGYMAEEARTNKNTNTNVNPTTTTNITKSGDAAGVLAVVDDTAALTTAKLATLCSNGDVFELDNTGGATTAVATFGGTVGNTNPHSFKIFARLVSGTFGTIQLTGATPGTVSFNSSAYTEVKSENVTPSGTTVQFKINAPAGAKIRFILNQLEEGKFSTSFIQIAGATATRAADVLKASDITQIPAWNAAQGTIIASVNPYKDSTTGQANVAGIFVAGSSGGTPTSAFYYQTNATNHKPVGFNRNSTSDSGTVVTGVIAGRKTPVGLTWVNGVSAKAFAGPMVYKDITVTVSPASIVQFVIGSLANDANQFNGYIDRITVLNKNLTLAQIAPYALGANVGITERALIGGGQSNMEGYFMASSTLTNGGEISFNTQLNTFWTATRNWVINGSTAGTAIVDWQGSGSAITRWKNTASAYLAGGGTIEAILWDQGESNFGKTVSQFKSDYLGIFQDMQSHLGHTIEGNYIPVIIVPLGRYILTNNQATDDAAAALKQAQQELDRDYTWIHLAPEKVHQPLVDSTHLTDAGYIAQGHLVARKALDVLGEAVSGGVDGPTITAVSRSGATVTVTITHDGGTDFTPTSSIGGFRFYDGSTSTEIVVNTAVRTNATTITLTLASTPSNATQILRYSFDQNYSVADTAVVRDNQATYPCPLRSAQWNSTNTGSTWANVV